MKANESRRWPSAGKEVAVLTAIFILGLWLLGFGLPGDEALSNAFFNRPCLAADAHACWFFNKSDKHLTFLLHGIPVDVAVAFGAACLGALIGGLFDARLARYRKPAALALFGLAAVPGAVALLKMATGHFCPSQLPLYGGHAGLDPKVHPLCYPAGHPSAAFGLLVLYFADLPPRWRKAALAAGLAFGGLLSIIQIARGEHFLSHDLATLWTALYAGGLVRLYESKPNMDSSVSQVRSIA